MIYFPWVDWSLKLWIALWTLVGYLVFSTRTNRAAMMLLVTDPFAFFTGSPFEDFARQYKEKRRWIRLDAYCSLLRLWGLVLILILAN